MTIRHAQVHLRDRLDHAPREIRGILTVLSDGVVQETARQVLEPLWEPTFHPSSHGFRPGRSCHTAIAEAKTHLEDGYEWVLDLDLEKSRLPSHGNLPRAPSGVAT